MNKGPNRFEVRGRAVTLVELLVALAVASIFLVSILFSFTQILRTSEKAEAAVRANNSARSALLYVTRDLAAIRKDTSTPVQTFLLQDRTFAYGDGIDNDGDGIVDEEVYDGIDNDGDWQLADDRHAAIGTYRDRPDFVGFPDLGDAHVDEDCRFGNDRLVIRIPPDPLGGDTRNELITYELGTFENQDHVLMRTVVTNPGGLNSTTVSEPLAFGVLGLDVLAWNVNDDSYDGSGRHIPYWTASWDASQEVFPFNKPFGAPDGYAPFEFPAAVRVVVTVYSGRFDLTSIGWAPGAAVETLSLGTTVGLEVTLKDLKYQVFIRQ